MKKFIILVFFYTFSVTIFGQTQPKIKYFRLQDVKLLDSPFKHAQDLDIQYILELNPDKLLAPFFRESGLPPKAESYTNWENTGLDGHIGGHYLSALSEMYASTGNLQIKERLDYMLSGLKLCQDKNGNGYIGGVPGGKKMWEEIAKGNIRAGSFSLNEKWVPLYNIHKTYAGLRDAYLYTGSQDAKEMLIKMTDWMIRLVSNLSDEQIQQMLSSEHGGLNETFADVASITGDQRYLKLAHQFSHQYILQPLLKQEDKLTGLHANTQIPKVIGFKRIADLENKADWSEACRFFWETVVKKRSVAIGGNSVGEHFNPTNDFSGVIKHTEGPETCNTYNMLRLTRMLYQTSPEEDYIEYYERALYNHILSSQNPHTGGLVYFTQMRPSHYRVYSQPQTSMWCCVGSGIENHAKYGEMIYAHTDNELFVNLFIPSELRWEEKNLTLTQENNFPEESSTAFTFQTKKNTEFSLHLRYPHWVNKGELKIILNGKELNVSQNPGSYIIIKRKWKKGDKLLMKMPMHLAAEQLPDSSNYFSFLYGPIVLASKSGTENMKGLFADDSRGGHIASGEVVPLKEIPIVVGEKDKLTANITKNPTKDLSFEISNLFSKKYPAQMELIPFYKLHESRYIIYWPQSSPLALKELQAQMENEEKAQLALDYRTLDKVTCGEQQPESDHSIAFEDSQTGAVENIHWRETKKWFSYQLKNTDQKAGTIYIQYFDKDKNRAFDVILNDMTIMTINGNGDKGDNLQIALADIPSDFIKSNTFTVKIAAKDNSMTPKVVEIRLLKKE